jgi:hypothetical protein
MGQPGGSFFLVNAAAGPLRAERKVFMESTTNDRRKKEMSRMQIERGSDSLPDIQKFFDEKQRFMKNFIGSNADGLIGDKACRDVRDVSAAATDIFQKNKPMLMELFNANTLDPGLQRQVILQEMLEEYLIILLPLQNFCTVFSNIPLEGTDEVDVPFYPLATDAGNSWNPATGYAAGSFGNTTTNTRPVVIGGSGTNSGASAAAGTAKDRKWVGAQISSYERERQPGLNFDKLMIQKARQLAVLVFSDIIGGVLTAANYGATVNAVGPAQFSADDIANLNEIATGRNWPSSNRCLVLDHRYRTPLLKDTTFKQYLSYGSTDPLRKAQIKEAYGFEDILIVPNLASYTPAGENLAGWINHISAMLVATAPIMPTPEVRALMTRYDVVTHPQTGISFEYRRFGDTTLDVTKEVAECSYGAQKGVASALARLTSA